MDSEELRQRREDSGGSGVLSMVAFEEILGRCRTILRKQQEGATEDWKSATRRTGHLHGDAALGFGDLRNGDPRGATRALADLLAEEFPEEQLLERKWSWEMLLGILGQELQSNVKRGMGRQRAKIKWYIEQFDKGHDLVTLALMNNFSPYMVARLLVEDKYLVKRNLTPAKQKKELSKMVKNPSLIPCDELREQVILCTEEDPYYSPYFDKTRETLGSEYEYVLHRKLTNLGISFQSEHDLRRLGMSKTPDVKLNVPIGVLGPKGEPRVIHWIDSKAMFATPGGHHSNLTQLEAYVNRFGPGLVIYWFGFVEDLNTDPTILLSQDLPRDFVGPCY